MRTRLAVLSLAIAALGAALTWFTTVPILTPLLELSAPTLPAKVQQAVKLLPYLVLLEMVGIALGTFVLLEFFVGRPIRRMEESIERIGSVGLDAQINDETGSVIARAQTSLRRLTRALKAEQELTTRQLRDLQTANVDLKIARLEVLRSEQLALLGRLAAGVAHEVGNPLMGILGYLGIIRQRVDEPSRDLVDRMEVEVQRINRIVASLLDLGRPPTAKLSTVDLCRTVKDAAALVAHGPHFAGVTLHWKVPESTWVRTDPGTLSQIIINLLLNAAQAMSAKGEIILTAEAAADGVRLHVDDTGPGLSEEVRARLFAPFFTTKPPGSGTGLGLAVSRQLAEAAGGRLYAENRPEGGARFTVVLLPAT